MPLANRRTARRSTAPVMAFVYEVQTEFTGVQWRTARGFSPSAVARAEAIERPFVGVLRVRRMGAGPNEYVHTYDVGVDAHGRTTVDPRPSFD